MARVILRRLAGAVVACLVSTFAVFAALYVAPGDPIRFLAGGRTLSPEAVAGLRAQYHLDDPFLSRYWSWLTGLVVHADLGRSIISRQSVADQVGPRLTTTLLLLALAAALTIAVGLALGFAAAVRAGPGARFVLGVAGLGVAVPPFVVASVLTALFAVGLGWFPTFGPGSGLLDRLHHLALPALALAAGAIPAVARITRVAVAEELGREHVTATRGRGVGERVVLRHVLRNAAIPVVTVSGTLVAALLGASVVIDSAFGLGGLGALLVDDVEAGDFAVVQAVALLFLVGFVVISTVVDLLYAVLDPRLGARRP